MHCFTHEHWRKRPERVYANESNIMRGRCTVQIPRLALLRRFRRVKSVNKQNYFKEHRVHGFNETKDIFPWNYIQCLLLNMFKIFFLPTDPTLFSWVA